MRFTTHALARMEERGWTEEQVLEVVLHPHIVTPCPDPSKPHQVRHHRNGIIAVVDSTTDDVVTVMRSPLPGGKAIQSSDSVRTEAHLAIYKLMTTDEVRVAHGMLASSTNQAKEVFQALQRALSAPSGDVKARKRERNRAKALARSRRNQPPK